MIPRITKLADSISCLSGQETRRFLRGFYDDAYKCGVYSPSNGKMFWGLLTQLPIAFDFERALDVGCGTGEGVKQQFDYGMNVFGIDIADASKHWVKYGILDRCLIASAVEIPFKDNSFDLVVCNDVLEHIPECDIIPILQEIYRVGRHLFMIGVALEEERYLVGGQIATHITIKDSNWWKKMFRKAKFIEPSYTETDFHLVSIMGKKPTWIRRENKWN